MFHNPHKPLNQAESENETYKELVSQSEVLLHQAMSAFQLQPTNIVEPTFPCLISGTKKNNENDFAVDPSEMFHQQEVLFRHLESTGFQEEGDNNAEQQDPGANVEEDSQLGAIRSLFDM